MERRGRDAAQVTVTPVCAVLYCIPRSLISEPSFDTCVYVEMEKKDEGTMDPKRDQLEPPSASTGYETPGQQGYPNWETGQTIAAGCLTAGVGSNLRGDTSSPTECVGTRAECVGTRADNEITTAPAASNTIFLQASRKSKDEKTDSEENKQFDPGGKRGDPLLWKANVLVSLFFFGEERWPWVSAVCASCFLSVRACLLIVFFIIRGSLFSELKDIYEKREESQ